MVRVLLVDDETDITNAVALGLRRRGFSVDAFNDSADAAERFVPNLYDVVILDIRMPRMNGFQVYRIIKKKDSQVRVMFLTAFEIYQEEFHMMFPDSDVRYFLRKPVSLEDLVTSIRKLLVSPGAQGLVANDGVVANKKLRGRE